MSYGRAVKPMPTWFRGLSYVMAALLLVCVLLQYNDPDPLRWMAIYGAGCALSVALPMRPKLAPIAILVGLVTIGWALVLLLDVWGRMGMSDLWLKMNEKGGAVEEGREAGGLGIQAVWLLAAGAYVLKRR